VPDLTRLRRLTGYEPQVHLDEILDRVIEYFTSDKARV
jgi:nucleoside-diphosphate-sugar epimerase